MFGLSFAGVTIALCVFYKWWDWFVVLLSAPSLWIILCYGSEGALKNNPFRLSLTSLFDCVFPVGKMQSSKLTLEEKLPSSEKLEPIISS